jgi:hypothetical protein
MNNYCTHLLEYFREPRNMAAYQASFADSWDRMADAMDKLDSADKFIMPDYGRVFKQGERRGYGPDLLRLPAPVCALEFFCPRRLRALEDVREHPYFPKRRIALCIDLGSVQLYSSQPDTGVALLSAFEVEDGVWTFAPAVAILDPDTLEVSEGDRIAFDTRPFITEIWHRGYTEREAATDLADEVVAAIEFMMVVNCENVKRERIEAPAKLNKKRAKNGKTPFYSYWLLDVFKEGRARGAHQGGSHNSPRFHFRRGHIRRYRDEQGNIRFTRFIKRMAVGNAALGHVDKTYRINPMETSK